MRAPDRYRNQPLSASFTNHVGSAPVSAKNCSVCLPEAEQHGVIRSKPLKTRQIGALMTCRRHR